MLPFAAGQRHQGSYLNECPFQTCIDITCGHSVVTCHTSQGRRPLSAAARHAGSFISNEIGGEDGEQVFCLEQIITIVYSGAQWPQCP